MSVKPQLEFTSADAKGGGGVSNIEHVDLVGVNLKLERAGTHISALECEVMGYLRAEGLR